MSLSLENSQNFYDLNYSKRKKEAVLNSSYSILFQSTFLLLEVTELLQHKSLRPKTYSKFSSFKFSFSLLNSYNLNSKFLRFHSLSNYILTLKSHSTFPILAIFLFKLLYRTN